MNMKVKDLIKQLSKYPQDLEIDVTRSGEFDSIDGGLNLIHMEISDISRDRTTSGKDVLEIHVC